MDSFAPATLTIPAGNQATLEAPLPTEDMRVLWEFRVEDHDVEFGVEFRPSEVASAADAAEATRPVGDRERLRESHGMHQPGQPGSLLLYWDNGFSMFRSKTVSLRVGVATAANRPSGPQVGDTVLLPESAHGLWGKVLEVQADGALSVRHCKAHGRLIVPPSEVTPVEIAPVSTALGGASAAEEETSPMAPDPTPAEYAEGLRELEALIGRSGEPLLQPDSLRRMYIARDRDVTLLHYLLGHGQNANKAMAALLNTMKWREAEGVNDLLSNPLPQHKMACIRRNMHHGYHGFDRQGRPVYIERTGMINVEGLKAELEIPDMIKWHLEYQEFMLNVILPEQSCKLGRLVDRVTVVHDLTNVSLAMLTPLVIGFIKQLTAIDAEHYPEILGQLFMVNAPWMFSTIWKLVSPVIPEMFRRRIHILSGSGTTELLKYIDRDQLPYFLGGDCRCEPDCVSGPECPANPFQQLLDAHVQRSAAASAAAGAAAGAAAE